MANRHLLASEEVASVVVASNNSNSRGGGEGVVQNGLRAAAPGGLKLQHPLHQVHKAVSVLLRPLHEAKR